jgi:hypothetical protein
MRIDYNAPGCPGNAAKYFSPNYELVHTRLPLACQI